MRISKKNAGIIRAAIAIARDHMNIMTAQITAGARTFIDPIANDTEHTRSFLTRTKLAHETYIRTIDAGTLKLLSGQDPIGVKFVKPNLPNLKVRDGFHD
jgi:hypothetical protein